MTTFISILRGINVGGHKQVKMGILRNLYLELGYTKVQTYIQSGNVIFQSEATDTESIGKKIAHKITSTFGFEVPVMVLDIQEMKANIENNPFISDPTKDPAYFHLTFLSATPEKAIVDKLKEGNYEPDVFECIGRIVYLYCPKGYGNTKLTNTFFENKLKVTATTRNWRTVRELFNRAEIITGIKE